MQRTFKVVNLKLEVKGNVPLKKLPFHCQFFPKCAKGGTCPFVHTGILCKKYPDCPRKKLCKFFHMPISSQKTFYYTPFLSLIGLGFLKEHVPLMKTQIL